MNKPLKIFIAYSHQDKAVENKMKTYLAVMKRENLINIWDDNKISPGATWRDVIFGNLGECDLLLYLVSASSLASKNCNKELAEALKENIWVIPIILERCDWLNHQLSDFVVLPDNAMPITEWVPESKGWQNVVEGIRKAIHKMQAEEDLSSAISEKRPRAELTLQQGNVLMMLGQIDRAIETYSLAITINPHDANAYNNRGNAYSGKGDYQHAIEDFNTAIKLKQNLVEVHNNRGNAYRAIGEADLAIKDYNKAIILDLNYAEPYNNRGAAYYDKNNYDRAINDFNKAIDLKPDYANAFYNRGIAYRDIGEYDQAIEDFNMAIKLKPSLAEAYSNRGLVYDLKGDIGQGIKDYDKAINLNPNNAKAYNNRGEAFRNKGEIDQAIEDFNRAIELEPDYAIAYSNRGGCNNYKGEYDLAINDFNRAIELEPTLAAPYNNRGAAYRNKGNVDHAIEDYNKAIVLKPDFVEAYYNRGIAFHEKGYYDQAINDYSKTIELKPDLPHSYNNRGNAFYQKQKIDEAIKDYTTVIELEPSFARAYYNRGQAWLRLREWEKAKADLTAAKNMGVDIIIAFHNTHSSVASFEQANNLKLPDNIVAILTPYRVNRFATTQRHSTANAAAYYNRAEARLRRKEWGKAKADLIAAKKMGLDVVAAFRNDYKNIATFERANQVKLPEDIAALVRQGFRNRYPRKGKVLNADGEPFEFPEVLELRETLRDAGTPLGEYVKVQPYFGINTAPTEVFVVDGKTRDKLIATHSSSADILKPFLHGRDIRRWQVEPPEQWLIFTYRGIEINAYPAIRNYLEKHRNSLSMRKHKGGWYELQASVEEIERYAGRKLVCPNLYNTQTFAVETDGYICGSTCYIIPTEETWLCGLLNTRTVEWIYWQVSQQQGPGELRARSGFIKQIPVPDLNAGQKDLVRKIVDYLIYLRNQPTTNGKDLAHARDFVMLKYFEQIINALVYEFYMPDVLQGGNRDIFKHLMAELLPEVNEIRGDKMPVFRSLFERLNHREHPVRVNLFFQDSLRPIRIIEDKW